MLADTCAAFENNNWSLQLPVRFLRSARCCRRMATGRSSRVADASCLACYSFRPAFVLGSPICRIPNLFAWRARGGPLSSPLDFLALSHQSQALN